MWLSRLLCRGARSGASPNPLPASCSLAEVVSGRWGYADGPPGAPRGPLPSRDSSEQQLSNMGVQTSGTSVRMLIFLHTQPVLSASPKTL